MDIGNLKENNKYYEGFEDEDEMIFTIEDVNDIDLHIWRGYFEEIFFDYDSKKRIKKGFTKDCHLCTGAFDFVNNVRIDKVDEYLEDLLTYKDKGIKDVNTKECLLLIIELFEYAKSQNKAVLINII